MDQGAVPVVRWRRGSAAMRTAEMTLAGRSVAVEMRRHRQARRLILRVAFDSGAVVVTLPPHTPWDHAAVFVASRAGWVIDRLDRLPPRIPFAAAAVVPVEGVPRMLRSDPTQRSGVTLTASEMVVGGDPAGLGRRVERWLRRRAVAAVSERSHTKAAQLGLTPGRISVRDGRSRWGSCAASGNLSYNWRLILAPDFVLDYVVAHEVAHLQVRGHGPAFWAVVERLAGPVAAARAWLNDHGHALHRYGPEAGGPE